MAETSLQPIAILLNQVVNAAAEQMERHQGAFAEGSPADIESTGDAYAHAGWGDHPVRDANMACAHLLQPVLDHLRALAATIVLPDVILAHATLARGALEAAGDCYYVAGAESAGERVRRYMNARLRDMAAQRHSARYIRQEHPEQADKMERYFKGRERAILEAGAASRLTGTAAKGNRPAYLGDVGFPGHTEVTGSVVMPDDQSVGSAAYTILSAAAHSRTHGLAQTYLNPVHLLDRRAGDMIVKIGITDQQLMRQVFPVFLATGNLLNRVWPRMGWDQELVRGPVRALMSAAAQVGGLVPNPGESDDLVWPTR